MSELGNWAVIDIETTGIDAGKDSIIDLGFLQFEGTKLVKKYSSLVQYKGELSQFIQKLTGIKSKMLTKAPAWKEVLPELQDLYGHSLIAHNSDFEKNFLQRYFDEIEDNSGRESYEDSLYYLALLFPNVGSLKLERFIIDFGLADKEEHRGFQDSLDLLKVLIVATSMVHKKVGKKQTLKAYFKKYELEDWWFAQFFSLSQTELSEMAETIELDIEHSLKFYKEQNKKEVGTQQLTRNFDLDFSSENIKEIFQSEEKLKEIFPNYSFRESQQNLSLRVGQAFKNNVHAIVQAPTGTGKTMGYLIPSFLFAKGEGEQVLISTGTKILQEQAWLKDVPAVRKILGMDSSDLKVTKLVGSNNHLCELLFRQELDDQQDLFGDDVDLFKKNFTSLFFEWVFFLNSLSDDNKILKDDLPHVLAMKSSHFGSTKQSIGVDFRSCTGSRCPFKGQCSYIRGLRDAKDADIIIGNHALTLTWPKAMPRPRHVILDEAHKIEEEATRAFEMNIVQNEFEKFWTSLNNLQGIGALFYLLSQEKNREPADITNDIKVIKERTLEICQMASDHLPGLTDLFEQYFKRNSRYTDEYWNELPMLKKDAAQNTLAQSILNHLESLSFILKSYYKDLLPFIGRWQVSQLAEDNDLIALTRFEKFVATIEDYLSSFGTLLENDEDYSASMKYHAKYGYVLTTAPIDVGRILHDRLLEPSASVFFTSATLGNLDGTAGSRGVEWFTGYAYVDSKRRFKKGFYLPPVYDYKGKTKVYLCDDTPALYDSNFVPKILEEVEPLIKKLEGKTLLLFSARKRFEAARELLLEKFEGKIPLFFQGMGSQVVEDFKESSSGILVGMESFGEGIDIPGESLQFVFIDKVPDLRMDQVINDRREFYERNIGNEFADYYLAYRTRKLHQKLGRLLRREDDFGGVIIVDSRLKKWKSRTINQFFNLMKPYDITRTNLKEACDGIHEFIKNQ